MPPSWITATQDTTEVTEYRTARFEPNYKDPNRELSAMATPPFLGPLDWQKLTPRQVEEAQRRARPSLNERKTAVVKPMSSVIRQAQLILHG
jgi:hypothetical protein